MQIKIPPASVQEIIAYVQSLNINIFLSGSNNLGPSMYYILMGSTNTYRHLQQVGIASIPLIQVLTKPVKTIISFARFDGYYPEHEAQLDVSLYDTPSDTHPFSKILNLITAPEECFHALHHSEFRNQVTQTLLDSDLPVTRTFIKDLIYPRNQFMAIM